MLLNQKETTVSYRCPACGSWVTGIAGLFTLSADMLRLRCPCGCEEELTLVYTKDKKLRDTVPFAGVLLKKDKDITAMQRRMR